MRGRLLRRGNPDPASYMPRVGDRFSFEPPGMYPFDAVVTDVSGDKAIVMQTDPGEEQSSYYGVSMPVESVAHFANDLTGRVYGEPSGDPIIDAVIDGRAVFLGKGDDGLAFRVDTNDGPLVVKASTTVPYHPFNPGHLTPTEAVDRLEAQHAASEAMIQAGVPGILPSVFRRHGDKGFIIKPYVEIPESLTLRQLNEVAASVESAHKAGWVFQDELQVGLLGERVYHFDTGKAEYVGIGKQNDPDDQLSEASTDVRCLKRLFSTNGHRYLTAREKENPIAEFEALYDVDAHSLTPEERKKFQRMVLRLGVKIKTFLRNHPDEDHGFWSDHEYADDEIRDMMAKFKDQRPEP